MTPMPGDYSNATDLPVPKTQPRRLNRTQRSVFSQDGVDKIVILTRLGKPPLRFKGCRLTHHCIQLSHDKQVQVELWQQRSGGFAIWPRPMTALKISARTSQIQWFEQPQCLTFGRNSIWNFVSSSNSACWLLTS